MCNAVTLTQVVSVRDNINFFFFSKFCDSVLQNRIVNVTYNGIYISDPSE